MKPMVLRSNSQSNISNRLFLQHFTFGAALMVTHIGLEKILREFLCGGGSPEKKIHLIWDICATIKRQMGWAYWLTELYWGSGLDNYYGGEVH